MKSDSECWITLWGFLPLLAWVGTEEIRVEVKEIDDEDDEDQVEEDNETHE